AAGAAIRPDRVQQDAGITHVLAAVGLLAPPVLDDEAIIAILLVGGDITVAVAGDVQNALLDAEDLARIVPFGVLQPGRQTLQVLAVEQTEGVPGGNGFVPTAHTSAAQQEDDQQRW